MVAWDRTDYDSLERDSRWKMAILSDDPLAGVPRWLVFDLGLSALLLVLWSPLL